jgi:hypothetical protein
MMLGFLFVCFVSLAALTVIAVVRRRMLKPVLVGWVVMVVSTGVLAAAAFDEWSESAKITECGAPLVGDFECAGFNDSWTECGWAFRAEGRPERPLCQRFLGLPRGYRGGADTTDYHDVRSFSEVDCTDWNLSGTSRCFEGAREEHEATNRYLLAFEPDCNAAVVLRACNQTLDVAAAQEKHGSEER